MRAQVSLAVVILGTIILPFLCEAAVTGQCSDCHTMHNSQAGIQMADSPTPRNTLLRYDCVGCHTGTNSAVSTVPYVLDAGADYGPSGTGVDGNTLAGGNFAWVASNDRAGHNVLGVPGVGQDTLLGMNPPGMSVSSPRSFTDTQLHCAGVNGCHGVITEADDQVALQGGHHNGVSGLTDGSDLLNSFRLLDGITGLEDSDWEFQPLETQHNQYKGVARSSETENDDTTISSLCAQCHGDFHNGSGNIGSTAAFASPWIRHPTDLDMAGLGGEYANYNTDGSTYSLIAPLGSTVVTSVVSTGVLTGGKAIVMCLSCHRAHGSPNDSILRWDYKGWPGNGQYNGCNVCHSSKM